MYTVVELQTNNGVTSSLVSSFPSRDAAEHKYHEVLMYASTSNVDIHSACLLDAYGFVLKNDNYEHPKEEVEE